jgi:hypothetical protein
VHAPDGHVRDAVFQLHRPRTFSGDAVRELLAFDNRRFAGRRLPEAGVAQQRQLAYLDGFVRRYWRGT